MTLGPGDEPDPDDDVEVGYHAQRYDFGPMVGLSDMAVGVVSGEYDQNGATMPQWQNDDRNEQLDGWDRTAGTRVVFARWGATTTEESTINLDGENPAFGDPSEDDVSCALPNTLAGSPVGLQRVPGAVALSGCTKSGSGQDDDDRAVVIGLQ